MYVGTVCFGIFSRYIWGIDIVWYGYGYGYRYGYVNGSGENKGGGRKDEKKKKSGRATQSVIYVIWDI